MRVLLVCTANICRSPMAQGVLEQLLLDLGLSEPIRVDSAASQDYFEGAPPKPMRAKRRPRAGSISLH